MRTYILQRLVVAIPSLLIASLIVFVLPRLIPGDVVQLMLEEKAYGKDLDELRAKLGLDRPIPVQYAQWMGRIARGDLGESLWTRRPVLGELGRRLPVTLVLGAMSIAVAILFGIPIGVLLPMVYVLIGYAGQLAATSVLGARLSRRSLAQGLIVPLLIGTLFVAILLGGGTALMAVLIGFMGFYVLYPLTLIVINSFNTATIAEPEVWGLGAWRQAFAEPGIWRSLWNSVKIGIVLQVVALPTGIFVAWLLARTNILFPNFFEFGFWISFFLPGLATTFGWMLMLDPSTGLINSWLRQMPFLSGLNFDIYSFWGIIWVHVVSHGLSTKVMLMTPAFRRMDASMEEASRMSGASALTTLVRITVPAMTPE